MKEKLFEESEQLYAPETQGLKERGFNMAKDIIKKATGKEVDDETIGRIINCGIGGL